MTTQDTTTDFDWESINNDTNGNPRYVTHFLNVANNYNEALHIARSVGGKKYHNKSYGGGIVFSTYSIEKLSIELTEAIDEANA